MIKKGSNDILGVFIGDTPVMGMYKGTDLIYESSYTGFVKLILLDNSVIELQGDGQVTKETVSDVYSSTLKEVILGELCTSIGIGAFNNCQNLNRITISKTVVRIYSENTQSGRTFGNCSSLLDISIPDSVTAIDEGAFYSSGLVSISLGNSIATIGDYAFGECSSLNKIKTRTLTAPTIQSNTFYNVGMNGILQINEGSTGYDDWVITTDYYLGKYNWNLKEPYSGFVKLTLTDGSKVEISGDGAINKNSISGYNNTLVYVVIGDKCTAIGNSAFSNCSGLVLVSMSDNVSVINSNAFYSCTSLTSIIIGNGVKSIGSAAFSKCTNLSSIIIPKKTNNISGNILRTCDNLTSIIVENGNTVYDSRNNCNAIIKTSTNELIIGCKNTIIPNDITSVGDFAFYTCHNLTSINIPNSVTVIGEGAFSSCSGLTSIIIPNGVTNIKKDAFGGCSSLVRAEYTSIESLCSIIFGNTASNPANLGNLYIDGQLITDVIIPDNIVNIGNYAFAGCDNIISFTGGLNLKTIGNYAFEYCKNLTSVTLGNSTTSIGGSCFASCTSLTSINLGSVEDIKGYTFSDCSSLSSITIPSSVTNIYYYSFYYCNNLTSIIVENGNTVYDSRNNCNAIIETDTNTLIYGCQNTIIPNDITSIGEYSFYYNSNLTSITIPNSVTNIGSRAFCGCTGLTSITIPNSVTNIGESAFNSCHNIINVLFEGYVESIDYNVFYQTVNKSRLESIEFRGGVGSMGKAVLWGCVNCKTIKYNSNTLPRFNDGETWGSVTTTNAVGYNHRLEGTNVFYCPSDSTYTEEQIDNITGGYLFNPNIGGFTISRTL